MSCKKPEDQVFQLAKELFLKSTNPQFLTELSKAQYLASITNSIEVAKLFIRTYEDKQNE